MPAPKKRLPRPVQERVDNFNAMLDTVALMMRDNPMTTHEVQTELGLKARAVRSYVRALREDDRIHRCGWVKAGHKSMAQYVLGYGEDVPPPPLRNSRDRLLERAKTDPAVLERSREYNREWYRKKIAEDPAFRVKQAKKSNASYKRRAKDPEFHIQNAIAKKRKRFEAVAPQRDPLVAMLFGSVKSA